MHQAQRGPLRVVGASWLYNLEAYRRLFPASYVATARVLPDRFRHMPLWGQFVNRHGADLSPLKPDKGTRPSVLYRGHHPEIENKIAPGRNHDPLTYEIETWASLVPPSKG